MYYLIMKAIDHDNGLDSIPNPVGVFRLQSKKANTLWQLLRITMKPNYIRGASLESSVFVGPELLGLADLKELNLSLLQKAHFNDNGFVVAKLDNVLNPLFQNDNETIHVTARGELYWRCDASANCHLGTYSVCGPSPDEWKKLLDFIRDEEITEAKQQPLTWQEAKKMVLCSGTDGMWLAGRVTAGTMDVLSRAIASALSDNNAGTFSHVQRARLEATQKSLESLL